MSRDERGGGGAPLRLSASVLLVRDDPFRVLLLRRHAGMHYPSALVFPGGGVEPADFAPDWQGLIESAPHFDDEARALRIAACRETWEETGILPAGSQPACTDRGASAFLDVVRGGNGPLRLAELCPFGHWITPPKAPRRFDTHFFLARAPDGIEACCDGTEVVGAEWVEPAEALARCAAGERSILFPTRMNIRLLAQSADSHAALSAARDRPVVTVIPRIEQRDDATIIHIPEAAGYGETQDILPRSRPG